MTSSTSAGREPSPEIRPQLYVRHPDNTYSWLADFEAAFCTVRQSWTDAFKIATAADANQDMAVAELVAERTDECERLYLLALEKETAAKLVEIMLLKRKRAAR